jgi:hypothetical protein
VYENAVRAWGERFRKEWMILARIVNDGVKSCREKFNQSKGKERKKWGVHQ